LQPEILNFRRGEFAYGAKDSVIRKKALAITWGLGTFFLMMSVSSMFTLWKLEKEERDALQRLGRITSDVLGKTVYSPSSVRKQIKQRTQKGRAGSAGEQLPTMSAWTVMSLISQNLPENALRQPEPASPEKTPEAASADSAKSGESEKSKEADSKNTAADDNATAEAEKAKDKNGDGKKDNNGDKKDAKKEEPIAPVAVDVQKLHIRAGKVSLGGIVKNAQEVDEIIRALRRIECFREITPGAIKTIGTAEEEKREFSIEITMDCL
jgi:hypothetical protein